MQKSSFSDKLLMLVIGMLAYWGVFFSFSSGVWAINLNSDKWFERTFLSIVCIGFAGVIYGIRILINQIK
jgi:hypothetical protein